MKQIRHILAALAATASLTVVGTAANANLITAAGPNPDTITIDASCTNITGCNGGTPSSTVSAEAVLSNFVWSSGNTTLTFQVKLTNTTPQGSYTTAQWNAIDVTDFGFNTSPQGTASGGDSQFSIYNDATLPGFNKVDVCASSGSSCSGGANNGLFPNQIDTFNIAISGLSGSVDLGSSTGIGDETYDFKIAGLPGNPGSVEFSGTGVPGLSCGTPPCGKSAVPEPASLAVLGTALVAFVGFAATRRRWWI